MTTTFEAQVQQIGDRLIIRLPDPASADLPSRGQVAADAQIDGHAFSTVIEPDGRRGHWISVDDSLWESLSLRQVPPSRSSSPRRRRGPSRSSPATSPPPWRRIRSRCGLA